MKEKIRFVNKNDSSEILKIYSTYILNTAISFEIEVPDIKSFEERIIAISTEYPYLVYEIDNKVIGYAYASKHRERAAYRYGVDVSIYFDEKYHGQNRANSLYSCLFEILKAQGYYNAYAGYSEPNIKSQRFHEKMNFKKIGTYHNVGYKFDAWHDVTWVEKQLQSYNNKPKQILNISDIQESFIEELFSTYRIVNV